MKLRALTPAGDEQFRAYLDRLRAGAEEMPPTFLLQSSQTSCTIPSGGIEIEVEQHGFPDKLSAAHYLVERLRPVPLQVQREELGLWSWLSLFFFDQLAPAAVGGKRKLLATELYIPSTHFQRRYRHLLLGPCLAFRLHGTTARLLLTKPLNVWSDVEEQLFGVQEVVQIPGALQAADLLYFDGVKNQPKRGITNRNKGGTIRRFREVLQQLDVTFDIFALEGHEIVELLPSEFDRYKVVS
ncbi:MAG TPA: hypothetical protein VGC13_13835 [Longimicrobium sp.]|jgi:hypothetical protein|uniref:hypothetical protein n=1 Tax=Longimicrobium sp. TaxID=2029185 RepID=UPI002ED8DB71